MRVLLSVVCRVLCVVVLCAPAQGAVISGVHVTQGGKTVDLSGLEWLSWDQTTQLSRHQIENGAGGFLDDGWRYARRGEVEALFDSLWGGTSEGWSRSNFDGALWLNGMLDQTSGSWQNLHFGESGDCHTGSCYAHYNHYIRGTTRLGWFNDRYGLSDGAQAGNLQYSLSVHANSVHTSSVLVRPGAAALPAAFTLAALAPTPAPVPLPLSGGALLAGLCALAAARRGAWA